MTVKVTFKAQVYPTENPYKVAISIRNMIDQNYKVGRREAIENYEIKNPLNLKELETRFPDCEITVQNDVDEIVKKRNIENENGKSKTITENISVSGNQYLLRAFHSYIRREEIIDTAYSALSDGLSHDRKKVKFYLNKQVAYAKRVNYPADVEALGSVSVQIEADSEEKIEKIIDWVTPPTKNGVPLYEKRIEDIFD